MKSIILAAVAAALLGGCRGATTRAAVKSEAPSPVTVTMTDGTGRAVTFADVAPGTTTPFERLPFESLTGLTVEVRNGGTHGATLSLTAQGDNVLTVGPDGVPVVGEVRENPDNAPFW